MRALLTEASQSGTLTEEEIEALQLQIDSSVRSVSRIAEATRFGEERLLDGSFEYVTASVDPSDISRLDIYRAMVGASGLTVTISVQSAADRGRLFYSGVGASADQTLRVTGTEGSDVLVGIGAGTSNSAIVAAVNALTEKTGVQATLLAGGSIAFESISMGSQKFVSIEDVDGVLDFITTDETGAVSSRDAGRDLAAEINGEGAYGVGLKLIMNATFLDVELSLTEALNSDIALGLASGTEFVITGGGATFQIGPGAGAGDQVHFSLPGVSAWGLGGGSGNLGELVSGGGASIREDPNRAMRILDEAIMEVAALRGRLGGLETNVVGTNINSLGVAIENVAAAESRVRDTNFALETAELARRQILVSAGVSVLASANALPEAVLRLLE